MRSFFGGLGLLLAFVLGYHALGGGHVAERYALAAACAAVERVEGVSDCGLPVAEAGAGEQMDFAGKARLRDGARVFYAGKIKALCGAPEATCYRVETLVVGNQVITRGASPAASGWAVVAD